MTSEILYEKTDGVARIRFNRPEKRNAITPAMMERWWECILDAEADSAVRVIVLSGEGESFSAGGDLSWVTAKNDFDPNEFLSSRDRSAFTQARTRSNNVWDFLWTIPKPVVAALQGHCLGGACEIAFFADYAVAAENTVFGEPEASYGIVSASLWALGPKVAREMLLLGGTIPAEQALRVGLVNEVVPAAHLTQAVEQVVTRLREVSPEVVAFVKRAGERYYSATGFYSALRTNDEVVSYGRAAVRPDR